MSAINWFLVLLGGTIAASGGPECGLRLQELIDRGSSVVLGMPIGHHHELNGAPLPWLEHDSRNGSCQSFGDDSDVTIYSSDSGLFDFGVPSSVILTRGLPSSCPSVANASGREPRMPGEQVLRRQLEEWAGEIRDDEASDALDRLLGDVEVRSRFCAAKSLEVDGSGHRYDRNVVVCAAFSDEDESAIHIMVTETN